MTEKKKQLQQADTTPKKQNAITKPLTPEQPDRKLAFRTEGIKELGAEKCDLLAHISAKCSGAMPLQAFPEDTGNLRLSSIDIALDSIAEQKPKDAIEASLIAQATSVFASGMSLLRHSNNAEMLAHMESYGNLAIKLLRLHNETIEALSRYRRGGEQKVTVVHVADKMAVVNNYGLDGGGSQPKVEVTPHA